MGWAFCLAHIISLAAQAFAVESKTRVEAETRQYRILEVHFPSPTPSPFPANNTVWGHLYLPREQETPPCVVVLPVMAAPNIWIEKHFIHALVRRRMAVMWLEMPYQFQRRPHPSIPSGQVFLARSARRLGRNFRQSVEDAREAITWLEQSALVDARRIGLFGISLGALVGASVFSLDSRPRAAILLLGGADFSQIVMRGEMTSSFAQKMGIDPKTLRRAWQGLDPMDHREANRGKRIFLINARSDRVIPRENALKLKEAFPDSRQLWVPFGHYSSALHLIWIPDYVAYQFGKMLR